MTDQLILLFAGPAMMGVLALGAWFMIRTKRW